VLVESWYKTIVGKVESKNPISMNSGETYLNIFNYRKWHKWCLNYASISHTPKYKINEVHNINRKRVITLNTRGPKTSDTTITGNKKSTKTEICNHSLVPRGLEKWVISEKLDCSLTWTCWPEASVALRCSQ